MNFLILKTIIDSTIQNYNHQNPAAKITDNNVSITSLMPNGVDLMIRCPHTNKEVTVRAEVNFMNGPLPTNFAVAGMNTKETKDQVNDTDVTEVCKALKDNITVSDLFGDKE